MNPDVHVSHFLQSVLPAHHLINFTQFHPVAAHLDHPVRASVENQVSVSVPGHLVAGMIHPFSRTERVICEPLRRLRGKAFVSQCQPGTADTELAKHPRLFDPVPVIIEQVNPGAAAWFTQGKRSALAHRMHQHRRTGFAGTIRLKHAGIARAFSGILFPAEQNIFQRKRAIQLSDHRIHLGRQEHSRNMPFFKQGPDHFHVLALRLVGDIDTSAGAQHRHGIHQACNKAEAGNTQRAGIPVQRYNPLQCFQPAVQHLLAVNNALGFAGGTGGIEKVSFRIRIGKIQGFIPLRILPGCRYDLLSGQYRDTRSLLRQAGSGNTQIAVHILQDHLHPFRRIFRVNRHHCAAGTQHGDLGNNKRLGSWQKHGNPAAAAFSAEPLQDLFRQIRGKVVHPVIGNRALDIQHCNAVRMQLRLSDKLRYDCSHCFAP